MGSIGASRITTAAANNQLTRSQAESLREARDYNQETIERFERQFRDTYDDRAYQDPFFDNGEYEDQMDRILKEADTEVEQMRSERDKKAASYWSTDYSNEESVSAARLQNIIDNYRRDYERQKLNAKYR